MSVKRVAIRYARSLFDLAKEQSALEGVYSDMDFFVKTCKENRKLEILLKSPLIPGDKKKKILDLIFEDKFHSLSMLIIDIIIRKKRENILSEIAQAFIELFNEEKGIITATLITAKPFSESMIKEITHTLSHQTGSQIKIEEKTDMELVGGFIINIDNTQYDASVRGSLRKLKRELTV